MKNSKRTKKPSSASSQLTRDILISQDIEYVRDYAKKYQVAGNGNRRAIVNRIFNSLAGSQDTIPILPHHVTETMSNGKIKIIGRSATTSAQSESPKPESKPLVLAPTGHSPHASLSILYKQRGVKPLAYPQPNITPPLRLHAPSPESPLSNSGGTLAQTPSRLRRVPKGVKARALHAELSLDRQKLTDLLRELDESNIELDRTIQDAVASAKDALEEINHVRGLLGPSTGVAPGMGEPIIGSLGQDTQASNVSDLSGPATTLPNLHLTRKRAREVDQNTDQPSAATTSQRNLATKRARFGPPEDSSSTLEYPMIASISTSVSPIRKRPRSVDGDDEEEQQDELNEAEEEELEEVERSISYAGPPRHARGHKRLRTNGQRGEVSLIPYGSDESSGSAGSNSNERGGNEAERGASELSNVSGSGSAHSPPRTQANATADATSTNTSLVIPTSDVRDSSEPSSPTEPCFALQRYAGTQPDAVVRTRSESLEYGTSSPPEFDDEGPSQRRIAGSRAPLLLRGAPRPLRRSEHLIRCDEDGEPIAYIPDSLPGVVRPIEYLY